jgi:8-oxo-dGTP pyrophosphatase MutT (NUDIX family)
MPIGRFLCGVAALIYDPENERYLLMRRAGSKDFGAGEWESVTGRVDQGENFSQAVLREVGEETGAEAHIEYLLGLTHFYRGAEMPENELLGAMFAVSLVDPRAVRMDDEHSEMRWATAQEANALLPEGHWLRPLIARAERMRRDLPQEMQSDLRQEGWEF